MISKGSLGRHVEHESATPRSTVYGGLDSGSGFAVFWRCACGLFPGGCFRMSEIASVPTAGLKLL